MSLRSAGHNCCYCCLHLCSKRSQKNQRLAAKYEKRKLLRRAAAEEIAAGVVQYVDEMSEHDARIAELEAQAADDGCDEPRCSCHARRAAAVDAPDAMRAVDNNSKL